MFVSNLKLWNFRKFGSPEAIDLEKPNLDVNFTAGINVLIGENDSGKTAIIDALKLVLKTHSYEYIKVEDSDFYTNSVRFRIEIILKDLIPDEAKNFTEWLGWEGVGQAAKCYLKVIYDVSRQDNRILPADVKAGVDEDGFPLTAEARDYLKATYLKPLRDAESELIAKRNSRLSQILLGDSAFKGKEKDHELVKIFENLRDGLKKYFTGEFEIASTSATGVVTQIKPQDGKKIKDTIDGYIKNFYNTDYESTFDATTNDIKSILEKLTLLLQNEAHPGLGTLNRLFMAAELLHLNKSNWSGLRLGLIEELEAHLHPQAQMQVIDTLQKQNKIQLILTTHSPNLASKVKLENLLICHKGKVFPMGSQYTLLDPTQYKFLEKFLDVTKANLFFAKGVILVEGWAEEILLPSIAKSIGIDLTAKGVSIVNIGNIGFANYANIFLRKSDPHMSVPVSVITDSDIRTYTKGKDANGTNIYTKRPIAEVTADTTEKITALQQKSQKNVSFFIAPMWTLEYCLLHSTSVNAIFKTTVKDIHTGTDWDTDFEKALAEKLINKGLNKTEIAYKMASAIDEDNAKPVKDLSIDVTDAGDSINYLVKAIEYAAGN